MNPLPDPKQPLADQAGRPSIDDQAQRLIAAVNDAMATPTRYRDETPVPTVGSALPVPQPGRTPMSQRATDASVMMLSAGAASVPIGGMTALVIYALGHANPVSLAIGAGAPAALAVPILALSALVKRVKKAAPDVHQHIYQGTVVQDQRTVTNTTRGVWASTRNQLPK
ncbi:hypothetical protein [Streptomyces sp. DHE17-7]|uniref:hypothetical protein n=1 Tax=Streptomyces sp. DHE17-7 TaxID=2759949 RepID=UPI0022EB2127|nr:hypothetical protein [Streptomyces sp. DHE17-7]